MHKINYHSSCTKPFTFHIFFSPKPVFLILFSNHTFIFFTLQLTLEKTSSRSFHPSFHSNASGSPTSLHGQPRRRLYHATTMFTHPLPRSTLSLNHPLLDLCRTRTPSVSPPLSFSVNIRSFSTHYTG